MTVLGLCCSAGFSLVAVSGGYSLVSVLGLPILFFDTGNMPFFLI